MTQCGVYVLYGDSDEVLYVGSSKCVSARLSAHHLRKAASRIEVFPCDLSELREKEEEFVRRLNPTMNRAKKISRPGQPFHKGLTHFSLTEADKECIEIIRASQAPVLGKMTLIAVIRFALRFTAKRVKPTN
jgi:hypothetical protein